MKDERAKHRTFTSMAQKRRWLALQDEIEEIRNAKKERNDNPEDQAWQAVSRPSGEHSSGS
jgi:hypothetical protein